MIILSSSSSCSSLEDESGKSEIHFGSADFLSLRSFEFCAAICFGSLSRRPLKHPNLPDDSPATDSTQNDSADWDEFGDSAYPQSISILPFGDELGICYGKEIVIGDGFWISDRSTMQLDCVWKFKNWKYILHVNWNLGCDQRSWGQFSLFPSLI